MNHTITRPKGWRLASIGELGDVVRGSSPRPAGDPRFFNGDFIPWLTVESLTGLSCSQNFVRKTRSRLTEAGSLRSRRLKPGTLIISNSGATLGVAKILGIECCANDGIAAVLNLDETTSRFLVYAINALTDQLRYAVATGNGQPNLNTTLISNIEVLLPPFEEQLAIIGVLEDVDSLINSLDARILKKRNLKQATIEQLLSGRKRLPGFTKAWNNKTVSDLGPIKKGGGIPKSAIRLHGEPCILYGEIYTRYAEVVENLRSKVPMEVASKAVPVQTGDIIFAGSGETADEIGKCVAYLGEAAAYAGGDTLILRPVGNDSRFLGYLLNSRSVNQQKANRGQGSSVVHLYERDLKTVEIQLPDLPEQSAVANVLSDMDAEINALTAQRDKSKRLKTGLMQELLSGRRRFV